MFQSDINVVYELFIKCQAIDLGRRTPSYHRHKLGTSCHTKYVGVIIQSELKFDQHINDKCLKSRKLLRGIKHLMSAKLLAHQYLCKPILEYVVWDPLARDKIHDIELTHNMLYKCS